MFIKMKSRPSKRIWSSFLMRLRLRIMIMSLSKSLALPFCAVWVGRAITTDQQRKCHLFIFMSFVQLVVLRSIVKLI